MTKSRRARRLYGALLVTLTAALLAPAAASAIKVNKDFKPQNEFELTPWISIHVGPLDMSINKAVFLLFLAGAATVGTLTFVARRLHVRPNRTQAAVELAYDLVSKTIVTDNIEARKYATRWFPFIAALFFFILFNNVLGFLPLPIDTENTIDILGVPVPQLAIYAATANLSVPLVLTLVVWFSYNIEGIREKGLFGYLGGLMPSGLPGGLVGTLVLKPLIFGIELVSQFVRLISLSVRLFANMLAGHILILIMGGGLIVLLGTVLVAPLTLPLAFAFYIFEVVLVANLQAFIFAILSSIYIGEAVTVGGH